MRFFFRTSLAAVSVLFASALLAGSAYATPITPAPTITLSTPSIVLTEGGSGQTMTFTVTNNNNNNGYLDFKAYTDTPSGFIIGGTTATPDSSDTPATPVIQNFDGETSCFTGQSISLGYQNSCTATVVFNPPADTGETDADYGKSLWTLSGTYSSVDSSGISTGPLTYKSGTLSVTVNDPPAVATPEPSTLSLLFVGLLGLGLLAGVKRYRGNRLQTQE